MFTIESVAIDRRGEGEASLGCCDRVSCASVCVIAYYTTLVALYNGVGGGGGESPYYFSFVVVSFPELLFLIVLLCLYLL